MQKNEGLKNKSLNSNLQKWEGEKTALKKITFFRLKTTQFYFGVLVREGRGLVGTWWGALAGELLSAHDPYDEGPGLAPSRVVRGIGHR